MNNLEEQTDEESMINSIKNGDQPLPVVTLVSIVGATSSEQPPLKDKSINKTAKDLWDALERHMLGSEYGEQDRKAAILYEYETLKATEGELLLDTYIQYLKVINDLKKSGYSKDNYELNFKFLKHLQPEWKHQQTQGDVNDAMKSKKKVVVITSDLLALVAEQTKVSKRKKKVVVFSEVKGSDDELKKITELLAKAFNRKKFYSKPTNNNLRTSSTTSSANKKQESAKYDDKKEENKTKILLANKDKDEQLLLVEDHAWMESSSDSDQEINANMVFMAQMEKVLLDFKKSSSSSDDTIAESEESKDKGVGLEREEAASKDQQLLTHPSRPAHTTWVDPEDSTLYVDIEFDVPLVRAPFQIPSSPEWTSGSLPISPTSLTVPSPVASPASTIAVNEDEFLVVGAQLELYWKILHDQTQYLDALPPTLFESFSRDFTQLFARSEAVCDEIHS
nr:hypothetical protein [Tanacetum cinerariifolium]